MVGEEIGRGKEGVAAGRAAVDIVDHLVDHEARRIIIPGYRRGLAILGPARRIVHALDRPLVEIVGARVGETEGAVVAARDGQPGRVAAAMRSEEHTSKLQSLMRISYAVFCLKKTTHTTV